MTVKFCPAPGVRNRKFYLAPNYSFKKFYLTPNYSFKKILFGSQRVNTFEFTVRPGIPELFRCHFSRLLRHPNSLDLNRAIRRPGVPGRIHVTLLTNARATRLEAQCRGDGFVQASPDQLFRAGCSHFPQIEEYLIKVGLYTHTTHICTKR